MTVSYASLTRPLSFWWTILNSMRFMSILLR
jgi:hypothetical protein